MRSSNFARLDRSLVLIALTLAGCAAGDMDPQDGGHDAQMVWPDSGPRDDAGEADDAGADEDAGATDGGVAEDGGAPEDAGSLDGGGATDAGHDGGTIMADGGGGCPGISTGDTVMLDGMGDLAMYPSEQVIAPFAGYTSGDQMGITWDADYLYVTLVTDGFMGSDGAANPLHVYLEVASGALPAATPGTGKEYDALTPVFEFSPTHLIAVRRTSDLGGPGPYNGVYEASSSWATRSYPIELGVDHWNRADGGAISVQVPWTALGCPTRLRLSAHVVNGPFVANEWKDVVPATATPWGEPTSGGGTSGGGYYEIDLSGDPAISGWTVAP